MTVNMNDPHHQKSAALVFDLSRAILDVCQHAHELTNCPKFVVACSLETAVLNGYLHWLQDAEKCGCEDCTLFGILLRRRMRDTAARIVALAAIDDVLHHDKVKLLFDLEDTDDGRYVPTIPHADA